MKDYIISYDIADKKRLAKLARTLEKVAMRIQNSVFLYSSVKEYELLGIIEVINTIIDEDADDVRIYTVLGAGIALGQAVDLNNPYIFWRKFCLSFTFTYMCCLRGMKRMFLNMKEIFKFQSFFTFPAERPLTAHC